MPTTFYSAADLGSIVRGFSGSLTNVVDSGTGFNVHGVGSQTKNNPDVLAETYMTSYVMKATANHANVINPVSPTARITKVTLRYQLSYSLSCSATENTPPAGGPPDYIAAITHQPRAYNPSALAPSVNWVTDSSDSYADYNTSQTVHSGAATNTHGPGGRIIFAEYDFTQNPNGDFPLGYCTYLQFTTNFTTVYYTIDSRNNAAYAANGAVGGTWTLVSSLDDETFNWEMEVEWFEPTGWTMSPDPLNLPDNVVIFTHPDPNIDEELDAVYLNGFKVVPEDPWVIIWTKLLIKVRLRPPRDDDPEDEVEGEGDITGITFGGRVPIGRITVNYIDLSGIYTFDTESHVDNLYDRTDPDFATTQEVAIPSPLFVTAFFGDKEENIMHCAGVRVRITGSGSIHQVLQSLDTINTEELADLTLHTKNNENPFILANFIDQKICLRVYMDQINDFMNVNKIILFLKQLFTDYPR